MVDGWGGFRVRGRVRNFRGAVEFVGMRVEVRVWGRSFESRRERGVVESGGGCGVMGRVMVGAMEKVRKKRRFLHLRYRKDG